MECEVQGRMSRGSQHDSCTGKQARSDATVGERPLLARPAHRRSRPQTLSLHLGVTQGAEARVADALRAPRLGRQRGRSLSQAAALAGLGVVIVSAPNKP